MRDGGGAAKHFSSAETTGAEGYALCCMAIPTGVGSPCGYRRRRFGDHARRGPTGPSQLSRRELLRDCVECLARGRGILADPK
jgi:hypothetical protein